MTTNTEQNKALVKRYSEHGIPQALQGNVDALHEYLADNFVQHTEAHHESGKQDRDGMKATMSEAVKAIPDLRFTVERLVAEGDYVVSHWTIQGTHTGRHKHRHADEHLEGTGAEADIRGMSLYRIQDGKIAEQWTYDTHLDFLIAAGAIKVTA